MKKYAISATLAMFVVGMGVLFGTDHRGHQRLALPINIDLVILGKGHRDIRFNEIQDVKLLPSGVLREIGSMANPNEKFQATDAVRGNLPMRRLAIAGVSDRFCILNYERGGIGRSWILAILELSDV